MDQELKAYLDKMAQAQRDDVQGLHKRLKENADQSLSAHEATRKAVAKVNQKVDTLWRHNFGDDAAPPSPGGALAEVTLPPLAAPKPKNAHAMSMVTPPEFQPLEAKVSSHDGSIADLTGRIMTMASELKETKAAQKETLELTKKQTSAMGIKGTETDERSFLTRLFDGLAWMVKEREGQRYTLSMVAAITGLITTVGTTYAIMTGRLPLPSQVVPTLQQPYAPPPQLPAPLPQGPSGSTTGGAPRSGG